MIKVSIERLAEEVGFDIGNSSDEVQANLLNGLCKGLANSMSEDRLETQICYLVDKLNPKSEKVLKNIVAFIELKEKGN